MALNQMLECAPRQCHFVKICTEDKRSWKIIKSKFSSTTSVAYIFQFYLHCPVQSPSSWTNESILVLNRFKKNQNSQNWTYKISSNTLIVEFFFIKKNIFILPFSYYCKFKQNLRRLVIILNNLVSSHLFLFSKFFINKKCPF